MAGINNLADKIGIGVAAATAAGIGAHLILTKGGARLREKAKVAEQAVEEQAVEEE